MKYLIFAILIFSLTACSKQPSTGSDANSITREVATPAETPILGKPLTRDEMADRQKGIEIQKQKLQMIIPDINFDKVPLRTAVNELRKLAQSADTEINPEKKGVNIFIKLTGDERDNSPITLTMNKPTLGAALSAVAKLANMQTVIQPVAISLIPNTAEQGAAANP